MDIDYDTPRAALLKQIATVASQTTHPESLHLLAEAFAWLLYPNNPHGGGVKVEK